MERPNKKEVSKWYLETIKKAELFDYGPARGTIIFRPYGYAVWELIQKILDPMIKSLGCENVYFPSLIPEKLLAKEKDHIKGFSPELAVVTRAGGKKLEEPLVIRPTSETIMYSLFSDWISSWRDLPLKINQWSNIVRWELRPFPFLRTTEFLWQEGHTAHAGEKENEKQVLEVAEMYQKFFEEILAIPVVVGEKTEKEKFAGAVYSLSCEALLIDGKVLQIGTVHNLGQNFSRPFKIEFQSGEKNKKEFVWQTSWGVSTRIIGGLILTHGDKKGLIFPPRIAPLQVVVVPIYKSASEEKNVLKKCAQILENLKAENIRTKIDNRAQFTPGWKFNEWELKGVPLRIEIGPEDVKKSQAIFVRRDLRSKTAVKMSRARDKAAEVLEDVQKNLFKRAKRFVKENTFTAKDFKEFKKILEDKGGFIKASWCGSAECEEKIKKLTKASARCVPLKDKSFLKSRCVFCGKAAKSRPFWARAY